MKRLTFIVKKFLRFLPTREPAADSPVFELPKLSIWTEEDADQLKRFLGSVTGQKLTARMQGVAYKTALDEAKERNSPAAGYDSARRQILSLSMTFEAPMTKEDLEEELGVMERHSP